MTPTCSKVLLALVALGTVVGCKVDDRMLMPNRGSGGATGAGGSAPTSILLGRFENDTAEPEDKRFGTYQYYSYNPVRPMLPPGAFVDSPIVSPGFNSNFALGLNWEVIDVPDGKPNYPGVGVRTIVASGFVDLSAYDRIVFAQRYQHEGPCQPLKTLVVIIGCDELNTSFQGGVDVSEAWTTSSLRFSTLAEPDYLPATGHTVTECLAVANSVVFQAQVDLVDGNCASGDLTLDNVEIRSGDANTDAGQSTSVDVGVISPGITIVPDANGYFDGTNSAGVIGAWWSTGDYYNSKGVAGSGSCPDDGFSKSQCSTIGMPIPGMPFVPDPNGAGMCTVGAAAQIVPDAGGQPASSAIWGNMIAFDLNRPAAHAGIETPDGGPGLDGALVGDGEADASTAAEAYDAIARGIVGFAFDIDAGVSRLRVEFTTLGTEHDPAYWEGSSADVSPVSRAGHYEIHWNDVGGPTYISSPPPFDPTKIVSIRFHVTSVEAQQTPYRFCIKNPTMLTGP